MLLFSHQKQSSIILICNDLMFYFAFIISPGRKNKENYLTNLQIVLAATQSF